MNERIITFSTHHTVLSDKSIYPEPARLHIPDWYKSIPNPDIHNQRTLKACKPFLDSLTAGYILKSPIDQKINFNMPDPGGKLNTWVEYSTPLQLFRDKKSNINVNMGDVSEVHGIHQVGGMKCPYVKENKGYPIYKILNPWVIHVPKGYSILYMQPINRAEKRFEILTGIVDSGNVMPVNFPCIIKKEGSWILERGTPIASVFPFKKESWKMQIKEDSEKKQESILFRYVSHLMKWYENTVWNKQKWK